jgi:hypothetical protein
MSVGKIRMLDGLVSTLCKVFNLESFHGLMESIEKMTARKNLWVSCLARGHMKISFGMLVSSS